MSVSGLCDAKPQLRCRDVIRVAAVALILAALVHSACKSRCWPAGGSVVSMSRRVEFEKKIETTSGKEKKTQKTKQELNPEEHEVQGKSCVLNQEFIAEGQLLITWC